MTASDLIKAGRHQEAYDLMVSQGVSPSMAEMFALQRAPGIRCEGTYMANFGGVNGSQFEAKPEIGDMIVSETRKHQKDFNPTGKVYLDQLVRPGMKADPEAWADRGEVRAHIKKVCEKRGWGVDGTVKVKPADRPDDGYKVAPDLIKKHAATLMRNGLKKGDAIAAAREKLTPKDLK
jgi:hypothetical protein